MPRAVEQRVRSEGLVPACCALIDRVDHEAGPAYVDGCVQGTVCRQEKKAPANATALQREIDRESRKTKYRERIAGSTGDDVLGQYIEVDLGRCDRVVTNDAARLVDPDQDEGPRVTSLVVLARITSEEHVQFIDAAVERCAVM